MVTLPQVFLHEKVVHAIAKMTARWALRPIHMGAPNKISGLPDYAHGYFSLNFSWAFVRMDPVNVGLHVPAKFEVRSAFPVSEIQL